MKGKDHIRSREEKNKRIRIKKGGKTRGKSIGKLGRGWGGRTKISSPLSWMGTQPMLVILRKPPSTLRICQSHMLLILKLRQSALTGTCTTHSQQESQQLVRPTLPSYLLTPLLPPVSYSHHSHSHLSSRVLFQHSVLFLHERDPPNIAAKHGVNTEL